MATLPEARRWLAFIAEMGLPASEVASLVLAELERLSRAEQVVLTAVEQASEPVWLPGEYLRRAFRDEQRAQGEGDAAGLGGRKQHDY
jgi:hypothetical protein